MEKTLIMLEIRHYLNLMGVVLIVFFGSMEELFGQEMGDNCQQPVFICTLDDHLKLTTGSLGDYFSGPYGCLGFSPNPSWAVFGSASSGKIALQINTEDSLGNSNPQDVDFLVWGPFDSPFGNCDVLNANTNLIACGYNTGVNNEKIEINGVSAGDYFVVMLTNYSDVSAYASLNPLPSHTVTLAGGIPEGQTVQITGKEPVAIDLPDGITAISFKGPGLVDTLNGIIDPCKIEGSGPHIVEMIGYGPSGCLDTVQLDIGLCSEGGSVACLRNFSVPLDENCSATLDKCTVLEGNCILGLDVQLGPIRIYVSPDANLLSRLDTVTPEDATVQGAGEYYYGVYYQTISKDWELYCWGNFFAEDYADAPFIGWQYEDTIFQQHGGYRPVSHVLQSGTLMIQPNQPAFQPRQWTCWQEIQQLGDTNYWVSDDSYYWDTLTLRASASGPVQLLVQGKEEPFIPMLAVFEGSVRSFEEPCWGLMGISTQRNWTDQDHSGLIVDVKEGHVYTLLISHARTLDPGNYNYSLNFIDLGGSLTSPEIKRDTFWSYHQFSTLDKDRLMLSSSQPIVFQNYIGGNYNNAHLYLEKDFSDVSSLDSAWFHFGQSLLGKQVQNIPLYEWENTFPDGYFSELLYKDVWMPLLVENCADYNIRVADEILPTGDCNTQIINRTYVVMGHRNTELLNEAMIEIHLRKPTLEDVHWPTLTRTYECSDSIEVDYPFVSTYFGIVSLQPHGSESKAKGNLAVTWEDGPALPGCGDNYSFFRNWTLYDWCKPSDIAYWYQLIRVGDYQAPILDTTLLKAEIISAGSQCKGELRISKGRATDQCSETEVLLELKNHKEEVVFNFGKNLESQALTDLEVKVSEEAFEIDHLDLGQYTVTWTAVDACGWLDVHVQHIELLDETGPTCLVDVNRVVTIAHEEQVVRVSATSIDEGSYDDCGPVSLQIRRSENSSEWTDYIHLDCSDIGIGVSVDLQVTANGVSSVCSTKIEIENGIRPSCTDADTVLVGCNDLPMNGLDLLLADLIISQWDTANQCILEYPNEILTESQIEGCGLGQMKRFYEVSNDAINWRDTCVVTLQFQPLWKYNLVFPADTVLYCQTNQVMSPLLVNEGCGLLTHRVSSELLEGEGGCGLEMRSYKIINWCTYVDSLSLPAMPVPRWDIDGDGMADGSSLSFHSWGTWDRNDKVLWAASNLEVENKKLELSAEDYYSQYNPGYFEYHQMVTIVDTTPPHIEVISNGLVPLEAGMDLNCESPVIFSFQLTDQCGVNPGAVSLRRLSIDDVPLSVEAIQEEVQGNGDVVNVKADLGSLGIGTYTIKLEVSDGCGNINQVNHLLEVVDRLEPSPICIDGLSVQLTSDLNGGQTAIVLAEDFILNYPIEDCSGTIADFYITFLKDSIGQSKNEEQIGEADHKALLLNCEHRGKVQVAIVAKDQAKEPNMGYCITTVTVTDGQGNCTEDAQSFELEGKIGTADGVPLEGVEVMVFHQRESNNDQNSSPINSVHTSTDGRFEFSGLSDAEAYQIVPHKLERDYLKGISTLDLVLISKHVLGIVPFEDPYQLLAADVNNSGSITTLDIVILRQNLLLKRFDFAGSPSWRFISKASMPIGTSKPWETGWEEWYDINRSNFPEQTLDFVAVKIGDVNSSAVSTVESRSNLSIPVFFENRFLKKGERIYLSLKIAVEQWKQVEGLQFDVQLNNLILETAVDGLLDQDVDFTFFADQASSSHLLVSAVKNSASFSHQSASPAKEELLGMWVSAESDGWLSEFLVLDPNYLNAEAYEMGQSNYSIELQALQTKVSTAELRPSFPNPFVDQLTVPFYADQTGWAEIHLFDLQGRQLVNRKVWLLEGENYITLSRYELPELLSSRINLLIQFDDEIFRQGIVTGE